MRKETDRYEAENVMKLAPSVEHKRMPGPGPVPLPGRRCFVGLLGRLEKFERRSDVEFLPLLPQREKLGASGPTVDAAALSLASSDGWQRRKRGRVSNASTADASFHFYTTRVTGMK